MSAIKLVATPEERLNYFRVCRIVLDHVPFVLRNVFRAQINRKLAPHSQWLDTPAYGKWFQSNDRWTEKLSHEMMRTIQQGKIQDWDATLLFHSLLHSSHCLLADKVAGTQANLQKGSKVVKVTGTNIRKYIRGGDIVIFDFGQSSFRCAVHSKQRIYPQEFQLLKPFPHSNTVADIYVCRIEWRLLERLSWVRNDYFGHVKSCDTKTADLQGLIQEISQIYSQLGVPGSVIAHMQAIVRETIADEHVIKEIEKYRQMWMMEQAYWEQVHQEMESMKADILGIHVEVENLKQDFPMATSAIEGLQETVTDLKQRIDSSSESQHQMHSQIQTSVQEHQQELRKMQTAIEDQLKDTNISICTLDFQSKDLLGRMVQQEKGVHEKLHAHDQILTDQESALQQYVQRTDALSMQQANTAGRIGYQASAIRALDKRQDGLEGKIVQQEKEVHEKLHAHDQILTDQESALQQYVQRTDALSMQQANTAGRIGYQVSAIRALDKRQDGLEGKITTFQFQMTDLETQHKDLQHTVGYTSKRLVTVEQQLLTTLGDVHKVRGNLETLQGAIESSDDDALRRLTPCFFQAELHYYSSKCHPRTRSWIFDDIRSWMTKSPTSQSRVYLIIANAGMGKSVIAGSLCSMFLANQSLVGYFFFQHNKPRRSNGIALVHTLAYSLSCTLPDFRTEMFKILEKLDDKALTQENIAELFTLLVLDPLGRVLQRDAPQKIIVIDALDECDGSSQSNVLKLVLREFVKLPRWLSVIITTRPDDNIIKKLRPFRQRMVIDPTDERNQLDIGAYLKDLLHSRVDPASLDEAVKILMRKSEGFFLYFYYMAEVLLERQSLTLQLIRELLPEGIDDYYEQNFQRLYGELGEHYHPILSAITVARSGIPRDVVPFLLNCSDEVADKLVRALSTFFPMPNECIQVFHASVKDWLIDEEQAGEYAISIEIGHNILANLCISVMPRMMASHPSAREIQSDLFLRFVLRQSIYHCLAAKISTEQICGILCNLQFLFYRLLESGLTDVLQDLATLKSSLSLSQRDRANVSETERFLRKNANILSLHPQRIFQSALNEAPKVGSALQIENILPNASAVFHDVKAVLHLVTKPQAEVGFVISKSTGMAAVSCRAVGKETVVAAAGRHLCIWNWDTDEMIEVCTISNYCDISPDGKLIVCGNPFSGFDMNGAPVLLIPKPKDPPMSNRTLFSPTGNSILCWQNSAFPGFPGIQYVLELWELHTHNRIVIEVTQDPNTIVYSACFFPDGARILTSHMNGVLKLWDVSTPKLIVEIELPSLSTLNSHGSVKPTPPQTPNLLPGAIMENEDYADSEKGLMYSLELKPRAGNSLGGGHKGLNREQSPSAMSAQAGASQTNVSSSNTSGSQAQQDTGRSYTALCAISPNGHFIAAASHLNVHIWDATSLELLETHKVKCLKSEDFYSISDICFSPDSQFLLAVVFDGTICWWKRSSDSINDQKSIFSSSSCIRDQGLIECCTFSKNSANIVVGTSKGLQVYDFKQITFSAVSSGECKHGAYVSCCSSGSQCFFTSGAGKLIKWSSASLKITEVKDNIQSGDFVHMSPDQELLVTYGSARFADVWNATTLNLISTLWPSDSIPAAKIPNEYDFVNPEVNCCQYCCISLNGIIACGYQSGQICIFYGSSFQKTLVLEGHEDDITWMDFSPDGEYLVSGDGSGVLFMWKVSSDSAGHLSVAMDSLQPHSAAVSEIHYSPVYGKMSRLASGSHDGTIHLYHGSTGRLLKIISSISASPGVQCLLFSSNGKVLASGYNNGCFRLCDGITGAHLTELRGHSEEACCMAFVHDSRYLVSGSYDGTLCVWDTTSSECLTTLSLDNFVMFLELCRTDRIHPLLACGTYDGLVQVMELWLYEKSLPVEGERFWEEAVLEEPTSTD